MTTPQDANPFGTVDVQSTLTVAQFENLLDAIAKWNDARAAEVVEANRHDFEPVADECPQPTRQ